MLLYADILSAFSPRSSGRLAKVNMLFRLMISDIGTDESSRISRTYAA